MERIIKNIKDIIRKRMQIFIERTSEPSLDHRWVSIYECLISKLDDLLNTEYTEEDMSYTYLYLMKVYKKYKREGVEYFDPLEFMFLF